MLLLLCLLLVGGLPVAPSPTPEPPADPEPPAAAVSLTEWTVPWDDTRPRDPYVGPQDRVWFVGQRGNYLAYLQPEEGTFERYDLPEGTGPHNVIVDPDGTPWIAGNRDAYIERLDPQSGTV